ncbi:hypothetical protein SISNIDRAFT_403778 [Sistotremastrum niveocremeum HHB9708]|uniref:RNA helicase n=1 Tax=Sistotremastrum niveocremeum HHB9708 TaxID=1314777 RepID=A0A165ACW5_9AGAM|nr:hypothetical protein SISNIDRAFT_403778 [Sistotremastrum niveocremeum HHB9708]
MEARGLKRKIIMHVGPTNSGKTYNALRALASAESGYYAGPLRLLAQEIWERFNRGTIEPLIPNPTKSSNVVPCNLITGEDRREVSPDARLQSCTIEMLTLLQRFHVGVVDEIQMMADRDRGGSWTFALIASNVRELHLCGEETAVPLVRSMLKETGDDLTVKYYKRLTPMHVDTESLNGNWANVRKGDCVVTFSRDGIFALKRQIEAVTGLRCAVAYGRLPPEIRSEQAALFNDPDSGYDVMVASDAVGMGLNLKIKRIVFAMLHKFNGAERAPLPISQVKQIAGRAGRYGLHGDTPSPGLATTFYPADLPWLKHAIDQPNKPLQRAIRSFVLDDIRKFIYLLPEGVSLREISDLLLACARVGKEYTLAGGSLNDASIVLDQYIRELSVEERFLFWLSPHACGKSTPEGAVSVLFAQAHVRGDPITPTQCLAGTGMLETHLSIKAKMLSGDPPRASGYILNLLESLHKCLELYIWYAYRLPSTFAYAREAVALQKEVQSSIEWGLQGIAERRALNRVPHDAKAWQQKRQDEKIEFTNRSIGSQTVTDFSSTPQPPSLVKMFNKDLMRPPRARRASRVP